MSAAWPAVSLGELIRLERRPVQVSVDQQYQEIGIYSYGRGIFHKRPRSGLEVGDKDLFLMREGDFIFQITFAWEGAIALCSKAEDGLFASVRFPTYRVNETRCYAPFLVRYFSTHEGLDQVGRICPGSAGRNRVLALKRLHEIVVPLPPLEEQRRIVARISELARKIDEAKRARQEAAESIQGVLRGACDLALKSCQMRFSEETLENLVDRERGISYGIVQTGKEYDGGVPTLRAGDLQWFHADIKNAKRVDPALERGFQRTRLRGGELLLRIRGGVGELAVCPPEFVGGNVSREIAVIPLLPKIRADFAMYMLAAPAAQAILAGNIRGTSYVGINLRDVRTAKLPVLPIEEQQRILEELNSTRQKADAVERLQAQTTVELDAMMPSILSHAFRGEI